MDPIVALISSYKEGTLIQGTIRSLLTASVDHILVFDGPTKEDREIEGDATDVNPYATAYDYKGKPYVLRGIWEGEAKKRSAMLNSARSFVNGPFWILTIDADEILVWGEYLRDWLQQLRPEEGEKVIPLKRTEAGWDPQSGFISDVSPSRLIHSTLVKEYLVSCWRILTPENQVFEASHYRADRQPMYGEPHIHHRSYLRRPDRAGIREHNAEEMEATEALRELGRVIPSPQMIEDILFPEPEQYGS